MTPESRDLFGDHTRSVLLDGGLSTALERAGHDLSGSLWTARLLTEEPEAIVAAHESYLRAGAEVIVTASYQASVEGFVAAGLTAGEARRLIASSTDLARRAVARVHGDGARFVAASIGPFGATLHDGSEYHGRYPVDWHHVRRFHRERLAIVADTGPDLLAIETIPSLAEAEIVLEEAMRCTQVPLWLSMSCRDAISTCHGEPLVDVVTVASSCDRTVAVGVNCTAPDLVHDLLSAIAGPARAAGLRLLAYPNHGGRWDGEMWHDPTVLDVGVQVRQWWNDGATLLGGCCGVGPSEIADMASSIAALPSRRLG